MSTFHFIEKTCSVCGREAKYSELGGTNEFGSPDLDLRPPEMKRSTMGFWVQVCPFCGYAAEDISEPTSADEEWLKRERELHVEPMGFVSGLAGSFYMQHLICLKDGKREEAFFASLHAAWACDDERDSENSARCRKKALELLAGIIEEYPENEDLLVLKADLMRRSGMFGELIREFSDVRLNRGLLNDIIAFEIGKAEKEDTGTYTVRDVTDAGGGAGPVPGGEDVDWDLFFDGEESIPDGDDAGGHEPEEADQ